MFNTTYTNFDILEMQIIQGRVGGRKTKQPDEPVILAQQNVGFVLRSVFLILFQWLGLELKC